MLSGDIRQLADISPAYIARMKCVCMMPLGRPVVPLVYMMVMRSPAWTSIIGSRIFWPFGVDQNPSHCWPISKPQPHLVKNATQCLGAEYDPWLGVIQ